MVEGLNRIEAHLSAQSTPLTRTDSARTLVNTSQYTEHEDQIGPLDDEDSLRRPQRSHSLQQGSDNGKPLLQAIKNGPTNVLESLLRSDTNLEETDEKGRTPLILAANLGKADMVNRLLISQSISINATDKLGRTALHYCAQMKMNKTIEMLLDRGADVNIQDRLRCPPMYYAIDDNSYDTVKMLLDHHATTGFKLPTKQPIPKSIKSLIDKYNPTGSTDPVVKPTKARTNSLGGLTGKRKGSSLRQWSSTEK